MNQNRPEQAILSRSTDLSKTAETKAVIERMVDGLNDHRIGDIGEFFSEGFRWMGNTGCGTKKGLKEFLLFLFLVQSSIWLQAQLQLNTG